MHEGQGNLASNFLQVQPHGPCDARLNKPSAPRVSDDAPAASLSVRQHDAEVHIMALSQTVQAVLTVDNSSPPEDNSPAGQWASSPRHHRPNQGDYCAAIPTARDAVPCLRRRERWKKCCPGRSGVTTTATVRSAVGSPDHDGSEAGAGARCKNVTRLA